MSFEVLYKEMLENSFKDSKKNDEYTLDKLNTINSIFNNMKIENSINNDILSIIAL